MHAEVLVELPARKVDRAFHYIVPDQLKDKIVVGSRVQVPFRRRMLAGYVIGFSPPPQLNQLKEINTVLDEAPVFNARQLALARWLAGYYLCPLVSALQAVIGPRPTGKKRAQGIWPAEVQSPPVFSKTPAQEKAWRVALAMPGLAKSEVAAAAGVSLGAVDALVARKLLYVGEQRKVQSVISGANLSFPLLTSQQKQATGKILSALNANQFQTFLLYGVTGSGKTEVYCWSAAQALKMGRQVIVLVPEISLTAQMIDTFQSRFGKRVALLHSRLSDGERYGEWSRVKRGEADVVLGARSALFAPLDNPGLLIVDEEHESSYKQEENPRYHTRKVAMRLGRENNAVVILGSATPSLESSYAARRGFCTLLHMGERVENRPLPKVKIVDMRQELREGNKSLFSRALIAAMHAALARKEQVILFLNRRGFSTIVVCRECGLVMKCPRCDVSLTYHANGQLLCHYCRHKTPAPVSCPDCRSKQIGYFGAGTQKIEQEVKCLLPEARILRLDSDTTSRKGSHKLILDAFRQKKANVLIGTQMVAKGLDISSVTLVGVVSADLSLYMPDFRASERTFQLLTQVAGRAGRSDLEGEALIQTYQPEHYAVRAARRHDYEGFYQKELHYRQTLQYPPFTRLGRFLISGPREEEVEGAINFLYTKLKAFAQEEKIQFMGPAPAPLSKIKDYYRWHLVLKAFRGDYLRLVAQKGLEAGESFPWKRLRFVFDLDPQNLI